MRQPQSFIVVIPSGLKRVTSLERLCRFVLATLVSVMPWQLSSAQQVTAEAGGNGPCKLTQRGASSQVTLNAQWCQRIFVQTGETRTSYVLEARSKLFGAMSLEPGTYSAEISDRKVELRGFYRTSTSRVWIIPTGAQKVHGMRGPKDFKFGILITCTQGNSGDNECLSSLGPLNEQGVAYEGP